MDNFIKILEELNAFDWKQNIRLFYRLDEKERNEMIITEDDKVYVVGKTLKISLGFSAIDELPIIVNELCGKDIEDIVGGTGHTIARTRKGEIYCWGDNGYGQLGKGTTINNSNGPNLISFLSDKSIVDICCGYGHSIVLTKFNEVYAWGYNEYGQIGNGSYDDQTSPIKLQGLVSEKISAISCGLIHSLALTENGIVYSWGDNEFGALGLNGCEKSVLPIKVVFEEHYLDNTFIKKICCGSSHSLLLSSDGVIFVFGRNEFGQLGIENIKYQSTPRKLNIMDKIVDIAAISSKDISAALSLNGEYFVWGRCGEKIFYVPQKADFSSFDHIFICYARITFRPVILKKRSHILCSNTNQTLTINGKYKEEFNEIRVIACGGLGIVCEAQNKIDKKFYAIKMIPFKTDDLEKLSREIKMLVKLKSELIVRYESAWIEENVFLEPRFHVQPGISSSHGVFDYHKPFLLFIKLELCSKTLEDFIIQVNRELNQNNCDILTPFGYFIASEIFKEIVESVAYLHSQNPQIIHRDLKPKNILITHEFNGRFVKLADFGLSTIHEFEDQSHTQESGTRKYMAPEVLKGRKYDTKADIFSLGVIMQDMFNIDINRSSDECQNLSHVMFMKHKSADELCYRMKRDIIKNRPDCQEIMAEQYLWGLSLEEITNEINITQKYLADRNSFAYQFWKLKSKIS